jgi:Zn-dependent peptidase ImmA (M78 family)
MENTSSVRKGDAFEKKVFDIVSELVANNEFIVPGKNSYVYWKKSYYSNARKSDIVFDVSIETFLPGAPTYSSLIVFECKDYKGSVPASDLEEFSSKLRQIAEHKAIGFFVTNSPLQDGALNFATSVKIGLARVSSNNQFEWIQYRKKRYFEEVALDVLSAQFCEQQPNTNFQAFFDGKVYESLPELLMDFGVFDLYIQQKHLTVPYKSEEDIEKILEEWPNHLYYNNGKLDVDQFCELLSSAYEVDFDFLTDLSYQGTKRILGRIDFKPLKISISSALRHDIHRWRFTLGHEVGHLVLHYNILQEHNDASVDGENIFSIEEKISPKYNQRLEIQANIFASHLLLPTKSFLNTVSEYFHKERINRGFLYLDEQPINRQLVFAFLNLIQNKYEVSIEVAKLRLSHLGLLKNAADRSINQVIRNMKL